MTKALQLFNSAAKDVILTPEAQTVLRTNRELGTRSVFYTSDLSYNTPYWQSLQGMQQLFDEFHKNPVLYTTIMIKARESSNMNIQVRKRGSGDKNDDVIMPRNSRVPLVQALYKRLDQPNVLQKRSEWLLQRKVFYEVAGNTFLYANHGFSKQADPQYLLALWNIWPQYMQFKRAGNYFEATKLEQIIKEWQFKVGTYEKTWSPSQILLTNRPNTELTDNVIFGRSPIQSLSRPLTNIEYAYEARNVMMKNRGARIILAPSVKDGLGFSPLMDDEQALQDAAIGKYGMLEGQTQIWQSPYPVTVTPINQNVNDLGLFEEIATDAMLVANAYGVPEILVKLYIKGSTFENQEASVRRLYQGTLIPEAEDDMQALSSFLGLDDTDYYLYPDFSHVAVLQESEEKKEKVLAMRSDRLIKELQAGQITEVEYRTAMGRLPLPPAETDATDDLPDEQINPATRAAQAELRGTVGGVQALLAIQSSVALGTTEYNAGLQMLIVLYGFSREIATSLLGTPALENSVEAQPTETATTADGNKELRQQFAKILEGTGIKLNGSYVKG